MSLFPLLPRMVSAELFARLCALMPPPLEDTDASRNARDVLAMAAIEALGPVRTAEEGMLAVTIVAADLHGWDALTQAVRKADEPRTQMQCRAQAVSMMRQRGAAGRRLAALQAAHPEPEPEPQRARSRAEPPLPPLPPRPGPAPDPAARRALMRDCMAQLTQLDEEARASRRVLVAAVAEAPPEGQDRLTK